MNSRSILAPNAVIFVMDDTVGQVPELVADRLVSANNSCVAIGCRSEYNGPTEIRLGMDLPPNPPERLVFERVIQTPGRKVSVFSALNEELMILDVPRSEILVRVYANDGVEPDRIAISLSEP